MATLEKLRLAETDANRVRKLNASVAALNALGISDGVIDPSALPLATDTTAGAVIVGTGLTVTAGTVTASGAVRTVLTLDNVAISMVDADTAGCHGSLKLYDFPACNLLYLGATCDLTLTAGAGGITDTAAVVASIGTDTVGVDNATLTDTEADLIASTAATLTDGAGTAKGKSLTAGIAVFDGTSTPKDAWLNLAIPDAGATADDTLTVSGTVTLVWSNLGDV